MAIDLELRKTGVSASEVAAVLGLSPYQSPFDLYVRKLGLVPEPATTAVQRRGKYFEAGVIQWFSDLTGKKTEWFDQTITHPTRLWQMASPDAWIIEQGYREAEVQAKTVNWRNVREYGEPGTDDVPVHCALQSQWTMSVADTPYGDLAALLGMDDLAVYRIWRDTEIEAVLLEEGERFMRDHLLPRIPPAIGASSLAGDYLKKKFPRSVEQLRVATPEEHEMLATLKRCSESRKQANTEYDSVANQVKLAIGDAEGLLDGADKVTWKRCKDTLNTDWQAAARDLIERIATLQCKESEIPKTIADLKREMVGKYCVVEREGSRRLVTSW